MMHDGRFTRLMTRPDPMALYELLRGQLPTQPPLDARQQTANLYAYVVAQSHWFLFRKDYLDHLLNSLEAESRLPALQLSDIEFLELLEYRLAEMDRVLAGGENRFHWPSSWPATPDYNSPLDHSMLDDHNVSIVTLAQARDLTSLGIRLHRELMGEFAPVELSGWERALIGEAWQLMQAAGFRSNDRYHVPEFRVSYDLHDSLRRAACNDSAVADIDRVFGEYQPMGSGNSGDPCVIVIYPRAILVGAERNGISPRSLRAITLLHELGHFWSHKAGGALSPQGINRSVFEAADTTWHESCAQALVHFVGSLTHCTSFIDDFRALLPRQSPPYRAFEQLLSKSTDCEAVMKALCVSRSKTCPPSLSDWRDTIE